MDLKQAPHSDLLTAIRPPPHNVGPKSQLVISGSLHDTSWSRYTSLSSLRNARLITQYAEIDNSLEMNCTMDWIQFPKTLLNNRGACLTPSAMVRDRAWVSVYTFSLAITRVSASIQSTSSRSSSNAFLTPAIILRACRNELSISGLK